jgi:hypothetical protein
MKEAWRIILWSMWHLWLGKWPEVDWQSRPWPAGSAESRLAGQELAGGYFCVPWLLKGDLDYFAKCLGLKHYARDDFCEFCTASKTTSKDFWPNSFLPTAKWKSELLTAKEWRATTAEKHWIFQCFPFLSHLNVTPDELHIYHLGVSQYILGSLLWLLVYRILPGDPAANLDKVWNRIVEYFKEHKPPCQFSNLTLTSFTDPKTPKKVYPKLKGKGAEIKSFLCAMKGVWHHCARPSNREDEWAQSLLDAVFDVQSVISSGADKLFLSEAEVKKLRDATDDMLRFYTRLGNVADKKGDLLFNQVPKCHWSWHLAYFAQFLSPRRGSCWLDEDFVRHLKLITQRCTASTPLHGIPLTVSLKYRWGMHLASTVLL